MFSQHILKGRSDLENLRQLALLHGYLSVMFISIYLSAGQFIKHTPACFPAALPFCHVHQHKFRSSGDSENLQQRLERPDCQRQLEHWRPKPCQGADRAVIDVASMQKHQVRRRAMLHGHSSLMIILAPARMLTYRVVLPPRAAKLSSVGNARHDTKLEEATSKQRMEVKDFMLKFMYVMKKAERQATERMK